MKKSQQKVTDFLNVTREDLETFIGPNTHKFMPLYDRMVQEKKIQIFSWSWAGFFIPEVWFFYRKMWPVAWSLIGLILLMIGGRFLENSTLDKMIHGGTISLLIMFTSYSKSFYLNYALHKIHQIYKQTHLPQERTALIGKAGGVSNKAAWISGTLFAFLLAIYIAYLLYYFSVFQSLPQDL